MMLRLRDSTCNHTDTYTSMKSIFQTLVHKRILPNHAHVRNNVWTIFFSREIVSMVLLLSLRVYTQTRSTSPSPPSSHALTPTSSVITAVYFDLTRCIHKKDDPNISHSPISAILQREMTFSRKSNPFSVCYPSFFSPSKEVFEVPISARFYKRSLRGGDGNGICHTYKQVENRCQISNVSVKF